MTIRLLGRTEIRQLARDLDFRPTKTLGQNFVHDANTIRRIVSASGVGKADHVIEVGPGLGSLTLGLLDKGCTVTAVELDPVLTRRLPATIKEHSHSEFNRFSVIHQDVLKLTPADIQGEPTAMVANLPYNVAVPALLRILTEFDSVKTILVMVQSEVADRLTAEPGSRIYGVPSVKVRYFGKVKRLGTVSPAVFWPIPRVYSGLVRIDRHPDATWPSDAEFRRELFELVDISFAQRRKTSRNAFAEWAGSGDESARRLLAASIDPARRGETLDVADFARLLQRSEAV
ncbi:16S rRNA (adenine(1518)-N(6)/adenine(1519)-N(6))-dimethyltransferase RsmA [Mycobacterium sp. CBMA271]|uniref:16S rRNA (adenine(1518)-N(6)/adenine(1519)-N(6))- dimethyltransferase RsmA n=1 Tax=unclassified Mycobacteroides TaxID=2618759 RepID=UPI0012DFA07F|nr:MULTISPECIES: 16S rRNA (adenine(1518)-N(6)/adenine(1519)-N(6))-dimethyltransferase RsmA [unclassified Mycobacteroides]MUM15603.1 16S rRNA (adenine(1518)-N(6)/adenine(1519)-N(6))-dimethyltransferase [Mycobacteroides sp. CBMA 326]MUM17398.1 16S rRNA (adenine(1518)-N(6)/adenine(1519)-N(6))-dimethyltransferase [Mycobacteroides sp. CBMA 326]MUM21873.1 16S rRNA (adenine(1518)-N(6)/adenine(1519)-N(6))-dimethyltransferase RsmA [Mycobacteroides sp. CBMA 271]